MQDLRDEAMRERHWNKLMAICGKTFVMDDKLQLDSLLTQKIENPDLELSAAGKGVLEAVVALLDTPAPKF